ncbi:MAG: carboxylating nicotinate-nucleotide diphosphorylase [Pseudomonadota bacterium]|nr:carboxylating nicotinate-nucleotide diphosphorylase [Pseudomonadota bacterium]
MYDLAVIEQMVSQALQEDIGGGDLTAGIIQGDVSGSGSIVTREDMVLCGTAWVDSVFKSLSKDIKISWLFSDGSKVKNGSTLCNISGPIAPILTGERVALNFLQTLSATASETALFVELLSGYGTKLLDTRKTIPLWRKAQKYAVICGGGTNHRMGLYDEILIKENHIFSCGSITKAVLKAKETAPENTPIVVEVENLLELNETIKCGVSRVMLDNFSSDMCRDAVAVCKSKLKLEVSGNITKDNIREFADTGVDFVSVGAITKNISAIDLSLIISGANFD